MIEPELTYQETQAAKTDTEEMRDSDKDIAYFKVNWRISEYAYEAFKAEMLRRKLPTLSDTLEAVAADLEVMRGRGNPNVRRYK